MVHYTVAVHVGSPVDALLGVPALLQDSKQGVWQPGGQQFDQHPDEMDAVELGCLLAVGHRALAIPRTAENGHLQHCW